VCLKSESGFDRYSSIEDLEWLLPKLPGFIDVLDPGHDPVLRDTAFSKANKEDRGVC
jgi:hypothetical protein